MFAQLVTDVASLPLTTKSFLTADARVRRNVVQAHIEANTISAKELAWVIAHNFVTPSADLAHAAVTAGNKDLFTVIVDQIKRGWDDVFPSLFRHASIADANELHYNGDIETLCRKLEAHGIGATTCSISMPPEACALLRKVRWRINVRRLSSAELTEAAFASKFKSVGELHEKLIARATAKLTMIHGYIQKDIKRHSVSLEIARQWVKSVALRRSVRPTHARLFSDAARYSAAGPRSAEVAHAMCSVYASAYVSSATPAMLTKPPATSDVWSGFNLARRARYVVAWPGPLQMAYSALQNEREDWFAAALCLLPPRRMQGQPGWREEANLAGRRIALALVSLGTNAVSEFLTTVCTLMIATGHGLKLLCRAGLDNGNMAQNLRFVWGKKDVAAVMGAFVESDISAEPVVFALARCQTIDGTRAIPLEMKNIGRQLSPQREYPTMLARRLRLPVLFKAESDACIMVGMCLVRCGLPNEIVSYILKFFRRLKVAGTDTVPLSMGATRLGINNIIF